jgi:hypothetical protein
MGAWLLIVYGTTLAITGAKVTAPIRRLFSRSPELARFISCPMCVGFWVGLAVSFALPQICPVQAGFWLFVHLANSFAALAACWIFHVILAKLGAESL